MEVKQIYEIMNGVTNEVLGKSELVAEDLSNIVDVGAEVFNNTSTDNYVKSLCDHIGKVVFVNRPYSGSVPSVLMDAWEYGSVMEKITAEIPEAEENSSWDLQNGKSYDPNVFYKPTVSSKFFNKKITFDVAMSFTERQVKSSFSSAEQLNGFISMIYNAIDKSMTVKVDSLVMRTINNMIAETVAADITLDSKATSYNGKTGIKAVNLLHLYNTKYSATLTPEQALTNPDFIRFASYTMGVYINRLSKLSTLFNIGGKDRFTTADMLHIVMLADFKKSADAYLQSDTYHNEFTKLPQAELVPYWQSSGTGYSFADISKIDVKKASDSKEVKLSGILAVMFDRDSLGVTNLDRRVTSSYNPKAEFFNNWYKFDAGYFNDTNENFVVFFVE